MVTAPCSPLLEETDPREEVGCLEREKRFKIHEPVDRETKVT